MRQMMLCAAAIAVGLVALDQAVVSGNAAYQSRDWTVERTIKGDRMVPGARTPKGETDGRGSKPMRDMADGCEAPYSPLVEGARRASAAARCIS